MPFDALIAPPPPRTLDQALADHCLAPVGWARLAAHKQAQLGRFRPGFWQRHEAWLPIALVGSVGCMAASGGLTHGIGPLEIGALGIGAWGIGAWGIGVAAALLAWSPTLIWLGSFALLIVFGVFRGRAGAEWQQRNVTMDELDRLGVPAQIAATARMLVRELPEAELVLGELVEDAVVLDPYLIVRCNGAAACLGIWDDQGMIARAEVDPGPMRRGGRP